MIFYVSIIKTFRIKQQKASYRAIKGLKEEQRSMMKLKRLADDS